MKFTKEHKKKISESRKGKLHSEETKKLIGLKNKGHPAWNKGLKGYNKGHKPTFKGLGDKSPNWKGGATNHEGYIYIQTDKPLPKWNGYVKRANVVWYEQTGEVIKKPFILHHLNHNKQDDRIENLAKMEQKIHHKQEALLIQRNKGKFTKI